MRIQRICWLAKTSVRMLRNTCPYLKAEIKLVNSCVSAPTADSTPEKTAGNYPLTALSESPGSCFA